MSCCSGLGVVFGFGVGLGFGFGVGWGRGLRISRDLVGWWVGGLVMNQEHVAHTAMARIPTGSQNPCELQTYTYI